MSGFVMTVPEEELDANEPEEEEDVQQTQSEVGWRNDIVIF